MKCKLLQYMQKSIFNLNSFNQKLPIDAPVQGLKSVVKNSEKLFLADADIRMSMVFPSSNKSVMSSGQSNEASIQVVVGLLAFVSGTSFVIWRSYRVTGINEDMELGSMQGTDSGLVERMQSWKEPINTGSGLISPEQPVSRIGSIDLSHIKNGYPVNSEGSFDIHGAKSIDYASISYTESAARVASEVSSVLQNVAHVNTDAVIIIIDAISK